MKEIVTDNPKHLPKAIFCLMFSHTPVRYKGKKLKLHFFDEGNGYHKKVRVGKFMYVEDSDGSKFVRSNTRAMNIYALPSYKRVATVVNGEVNKV